MQSLLLGEVRRAKVRAKKKTNVKFFFLDLFNLRHRLRRKGGTARSGDAVISPYT